MEQRNRLLSIICVILAAACVVLAGKSCTEDAQKANSNKQKQVNNGYNIITQNVNSLVEATTTFQGTTSIDVLGNVIYETVTQAVVVTDTNDTEVLITSEATTSYDVLGNLVTEPPSDTVTTVADDSMQNGESTTPSGFGGFDHDENGSSSSVTTDDGEEATLPADFKIIIR